MKVDLSVLPTDVDALHGLVHALVGELKARELRVEQLEARIAKLQRLQFGRSSERRTQEIEQLQLALDDLQEGAGAAAADRPAALQRALDKPVRRPLPDHLPREEVIHAVACACPRCGGTLRRLGEEVTEVLDYVPASFKVIRHVRPKFSCRTCEAITVAPMPSLPIERGRPGAGLLAHVLVSKYADHLPLYRQSAITPATASSWNARPWPIGLASRRHSCSPWSRRCAAR
jgi:transposase